jgi:hypothetical protein
MLVLLGIAMLVKFERIDTWQQRRFPDVRSLDEMAGRGVRRVRNTGSPWRGHQPHVKCGLALDAPQLHDRDSAGPSLAAMVNFAMLGGSPGSACV